MIIVLIFCNLYDTFFYKRKLFNDQRNQLLVRTVEHSRGNVTYLIFISPSGELHAVNYTLDSMDYEMHKKFDR